MQSVRRTGVLSAFLVALAVGTTTGCSSGELGPIGDPSGGGGNDGLPPGGPTGTTPDGGTVTNPTGPDAGPPKLVYSGRYELTSIVDLAGAGAFGDTISTTLVQLSQFHDHPAATILNLMALYDVPYFSEVWDVLPGFLKDKVTDLLDELIVDAVFDNIPVIDQAAQFIADIGEASRNVELVTDMVLTGPVNGGVQMRGSHTMKSLGFSLFGLHATIPVPTAFQQITQLEVRGAIDTSVARAGGPSAHLTLSRQNFAIPYGDMIMDAFKELVFEPAGTEDLGGWLNHIIDCGSIADDLGNICILGACVSDLVSISTMDKFCTGGLGILGTVVETAVRSLKIDLADLNNGACDMYDKGYADTQGDGKMDALSNGNWDMTITLSGQAKTVKSPFDGKRIADQ